MTDPPALPPGVKPVYPLPGLTGEEWVRATDYDVIGAELLAALWEQAKAEINQAFAERFGTPPGWALDLVVGLPPVPAELCSRRPGDRPRGRLRMRPGAYHGPLPDDYDALRFLAGWSERRGLYSVAGEPVALPERFR